MAKPTAASEMLRGAASKECPSSTPHPIITWELAASDDGDGAAMTRRPACPGARSSLFINFYNIRGPFTDFPFVEHHLSLLLNLISCSYPKLSCLSVLTANLILLPPTVSFLNFQPNAVVAHMCATMLFVLVSLIWSLLNFLPYG
ncbi:UNVERIFIED_CONTAM: hypothetical protein RMT77_019752 [Armadillidium vulgare]